MSGAYLYHGWYIHSGRACLPGHRYHAQLIAGERTRAQLWDDSTPHLKLQIDAHHLTDTRTTHETTTMPHDAPKITIRSLSNTTPLGQLMPGDLFRHYGSMEGRVFVKGARVSDNPRDVEDYYIHSLGSPISYITRPPDTQIVPLRMVSAEFEELV